MSCPFSQLSPFSVDSGQEWIPFRWPSVVRRNSW